MVLLILYILSFILVAVVGVMAARSDFKGLTIDNWYSGVVVALFVFCYGAMWLGGRADVFGALPSHLLSAFIVFVVTLLMFLAKGLGAADSKLGTAYALWTGLAGLMPFLFYMALVGGLLGLGALVLKKFKPFEEPKEGGWIARVQAGENKVPYGIAIVAGALASFVKIGYFSPEVLASFVSP